MCGERQTFFSSKRIDPSNDKSRFDINIRTVITFRKLGLGYTPLLNFSRHMNMPAPLKQFSYERIMNMIHPYYAQAAEESMNKAASNVTKSSPDDKPTDIVASFDGFWQRRGFASLNGIVSCIERENNKIVDVAVKTKKCKSCVFWEKKKTLQNTLIGKTNMFVTLTIRALHQRWRRSVHWIFLSTPLRKEIYATQPTSEMVIHQPIHLLLKLIPTMGNRLTKENVSAMFKSASVKI